MPFLMLVEGNPSTHKLTVSLVMKHLVSYVVLLDCIRGKAETVQGGKRIHFAHVKKVEKQIILGHKLATFMLTGKLVGTSPETVISNVNTVNRMEPS